MSKRPSIIDDVLPPPRLAAAPTAEVVALPTSQPQEAKPTGDMMRTSIYIPRAAHRRLREIAFVEDVRVNDLIMEGIDNVIAKRGHAEKASRKPKAS